MAPPSSPRANSFSWLPQMTAKRPGFRGQMSIWRRKCAVGGAISGIATSYIATDYRNIIATPFPHLIALISEPGIGGEIVSF